MMSTLTLMLIFDIGFPSEPISEKIGGIVVFSLFNLFGIGYVAYMHLYKVFDRIIEINEEGIQFIAINKKAIMKWHEVKEIYVHSSTFYFAFARVICFNGKDWIPRKQWTINDKWITSEFTDEMLDEIKKYWYGEIGNVKYYFKYKEKRRMKLEKKKTINK